MIVGNIANIARLLFNAEHSNVSMSSSIKTTKHICEIMRNTSDTHESISLRKGMHYNQPNG